MISLKKFRIEAAMKLVLRGVLVPDGLLIVGHAEGMLFLENVVEDFELKLICLL